MLENIIWFKSILNNLFALYFQEKNEKTEIPELLSGSDLWLRNIAAGHELTYDEKVILLLALMPHLKPEILDLFFLKNKSFDRTYTEFGGWHGESHSGFLPTGETAIFMLTVQNPDKRIEVVRLFQKEHWFYTDNILRLERHGQGEPFLSGRLRVSDDCLFRIFGTGKYKPDYNADFPAKCITTLLDWNDLVLPFHLREELDNIVCWLQNQQEIRARWRLDRIIKPGYRCLFYGPPGTGKTLTATLIGKQNNMDVYRIDLSMIVSKYIGETEKNLSRIFDQAEHQDWILFFDEADALFGKRTETNTSNDRYANQEVAYLLQRIEDFPGMVILATNLRDNIDDAFFRRFQSALYFPMPDQRLRYHLWKQMMPSEWLPEEPESLLDEISAYKLSGGSIVNIIQTCALKLYHQDPPSIHLQILKEAIGKEQQKEGKIIDG